MHRIAWVMLLAAFCLLHGQPRIVESARPASTDCTSPDYTYAETGACANNCQCDGARTCIATGVCAGAARSGAGAGGEAKLRVCQQLLSAGRPLPSICQTVCGEGGALCSAAGCSDLATDRENCGSCGRRCELFGFWGECVAGACDYSRTCFADGYIFCDTGPDGSPGCVPPATDRTNCGGCGVVCGDEEYCVLGTCGPDPCEAGLAYCPASNDECGGDPSCDCVDLQNDSDNCNECGRSCDASSGAARCENGQCIQYCIEPEVLCGFECANLDNNIFNCGDCGTVCDYEDGEVCDGGACTPPE